MKTKLSKILGVGLALLMVFGLAFALMPAKQAEAQLSTSPNQWLTQSPPGGPTATNTLRNSDVGGIAIGNDGVTMYAIDTNPTTAAILKSSSAGAIFAPVTNPGWAANVAARLIAISPDNPLAIAVVDNTTAATPTVAAGQVWISNNGGTTWAQLNMAGTGVNGNQEVRAIAVGPTRAGTILNRDYAIAISDNTGGTRGDVWFCGLNTTWVSAAAGGIGADNLTGDNFDFTSVAFTPSFVGDRCLVAVGSDNASGGFNTGDTYLFVIQTADVPAPGVAGVLAPYPVRMVTATANDSPRDYPAGILQSSIALPADFDPTSPPSGFRTFVGWSSVAGPGVAGGWDDVWRVDYTTVRQLQTGCASGIWSIAYSGVISGGTLIAGERTSTDNSTTIVWAATDPQLAQPSFVGSAKAPTGRTNCNVAMVSPNVCYAGTTGVESAFSVSRDGGASFNGLSLINTEITGIQDVMPTPDGKYVFMATSDNTTVVLTGSGSGRESLWKSATPVTFYGWERVRMSTTNWGDAIGDAIVRLSPYYLDDTTLYWCDRNATTVQRSATGGDTFSNRTAPAAIGDVAVENANVVYMSSGANFYSSTGGAWGGSWSLPIATGLAPINSLVMCPTYPEKPEAGNLLAGCATGVVGISLDAGASWATLLPTVPAGGTEQVLAHSDWANKKLVYAGDSTLNTGIYRYEYGVSNAWEQIRAPTLGGPMTGLAMAGGVLYGSENFSVERQLYPTLGVADMAGLGWGSMNVGAGAARLFNSTPSALRAVVRDGEVNLWAIDTTGTDTLMAYDDSMAFATPTATVPATVAYDPNSQGSAQFTISWPAISNATDYDLWFFTDAACTNLVGTWTSATAVPATAFRPASAAAPSATILANTFSAGQDYWLLIRAVNQVPGDAINSPLSAPIKFTVEIGVPISAPGVGPVLTSPQAGATDVDPSAVVFTWGSMLSATEYEFILATDSALTNTIGGTPAYVTTPSFGPVTLDAGQSYFFAVKVTKPSVSPQSIGSFTTSTTVTVWTDPATGLTYPTREALEAALAARKAQATPMYIWIVIAIGAILVIAVIWLIFTTRKT